MSQGEAVPGPRAMSQGEALPGEYPNPGTAAWLPVARTGTNLVSASNRTSGAGSRGESESDRFRYGRPRAAQVVHGASVAVVTWLKLTLLS